MLIIHAVTEDDKCHLPAGSSYLVYSFRADEIALHMHSCTEVYQLLCYFPLLVFLMLLICDASHYGSP